MPQISNERQTDREFGEDLISYNLDTGDKREGIRLAYNLYEMWLKFWGTLILRKKSITNLFWRWALDENWSNISWKKLSCKNFCFLYKLRKSRLMKDKTKDEFYVRGTRKGVRVFCDNSL